MPHPEPTTDPAHDAAGPRYPQVRVRRAGADGNTHILIGKVAVALRRHVGDNAADLFNAAARQCGSDHERRQLIQATVRIR